MTRLLLMAICMTALAMAGCESSPATEAETTLQMPAENRRHSLGSDTPRYHLVSGSTGMIDRRNTEDRGAGSMAELAGEEVGKAPAIVDEKSGNGIRPVVTIPADAVAIDENGRPIRIDM